MPGELFFFSLVIKFIDQFHPTYLMAVMKMNGTATGRPVQPVALMGARGFIKLRMQEFTLFDRKTTLIRIHFLSIMNAAFRIFFR
jgi:hypothetical protein